MNITNEQLRWIIKEELEQVLSEAEAVVVNAQEEKVLARAMQKWNLGFGRGIKIARPIKGSRDNVLNLDPLYDYLQKNPKQNLNTILNDISMFKNYNTDQKPDYDLIKLFWPGQAYATNYWSRHGYWKPVEDVKNQLTGVPAVLANFPAEGQKQEFVNLGALFQFLMSKGSKIRPVSMIGSPVSDDKGQHLWVKIQDNPIIPSAKQEPAKKRSFMDKVLRRNK